MGQRHLLSALLVLTIIAPLFSGCFGSEEETKEVIEDGPFSFSQPLPMETFYHFAGGINALNQSAVDAANITANLTGNNTPFYANGTYFGIGFTTFEPTLGITSTGSMFFTNYRGTGDGTHIIKGTNYGQDWEDVGPFNPLFPTTGQVPSSNDPYVYVDKWTDRVVKFDMHALTAMFVEYSDDDGSSWSIPLSAEGYYSPQDHQSIASMLDVNGIGFHDTIYVFCINTGSSALGPQCSRSLNGGVTWDVQRPGYPIGTPQCSGLHGHVAGGSDGSVYRGNPSCDGPAVYRSLDGGYTWTEHTITTEIGMQQGWHSHEVAVAVDEAGNVHASWISTDEMPWYAYSRDQGDTWSEPMMIAAPGVNQTGFPTIFAGDEGRVALGYIGLQNGQAGWNGYMAVMTDAFSEFPLITSVSVNLFEDPLDITEDCGDVRCGGFGDFIDIEIDDEGRPWIALAHNVRNQEGIVGTMITGPSLYGDIIQLEVIEAGGNTTLSL
ncbi:MAG: sialidase family protein [Candidatus Poseidoniales archaeon]|jgi:hypothetical protein